MTVEQLGDMASHEFQRWKIYYARLAQRAELERKTRAAMGG